MPRNSFFYTLDQTKCNFHNIIIWQCKNYFTQKKKISMSVQKFGSKTTKMQFVEMYCVLITNNTEIRAKTVKNAACPSAEQFVSCSSFFIFFFFFHFIYMIHLGRWTKKPNRVRHFVRYRKSCKTAWNALETIEMIWKSYAFDKCRINGNKILNSQRSNECCNQVKLKRRRKKNLIFKAKSKKKTKYKTAATATKHSSCSGSSFAMSMTDPTN